MSETKKEGGKLPVPQMMLAASCAEVICERQTMIMITMMLHDD